MARGRPNKLSQYACPMNAPGSGSYPLNTKARISSAKGYYGRRNTTHCKGGRKRICRAARVKGMMKGDSRQAKGWKRWCR